MDPIYFSQEFDSENYNWMSRFSGLLWTEVYPDAVYVDLHSTHLSNAIKALTHAGRLEWDSTIYTGFNMQPALMVYEYSQNRTRQAQARGLVDWLLAAVAIKHLDGGTVGPDARAKHIGALPLTGSAWFYLYMFGSDSHYTPSISLEQFQSAVELDTLGQLTFSSYTPPQAIVDIIQRQFPTPVLMHNAKPFYRIDTKNYAGWAGDTHNSHKFEFETLYLERNYTLGSVAAGRPNGAYAWPGFGLYGNSSTPFTEQSVWRLGVLSNGLVPGPQQVFGNTGREFPDLSGRSPYEQLGQSDRTILRVFTATDEAWVAVPNTTTVVVNGTSAFASFGHGVYAAWQVLSSAAKLTQQPYYNPGQGALQLMWTDFSNTSLNAIVLEVGSAPAYTSFSQFRLAVVQRTRIETSTPYNTSSIGSVTYSDTEGGTLTVEHTGFCPYRMRDGTIVALAGCYPFVTVNGSRVAFADFESYKVVKGQPILNQDWGSGIMTMDTGHSQYKMEVDQSGQTSFFVQ
jgi:hypothetical protein